MRNKTCEEIIKQIKDKYPDLKTGYYYDDNIDEFIICHDNKELEFNNIEFNEFIGRILYESVLKNKIFNIVFGYDCDF